MQLLLRAVPMGEGGRRSKQTGFGSGMGPDMVSRVGELTVNLSQDFGMMFEHFGFNNTRWDLAPSRSFQRCFEMREWYLPRPTN
jgi:hypothetical protein